MQTKTIFAGDREIAEVLSKGVLIKTTQDALDLIGNINSEYLILHEYNFEKDFFDLRTLKLGEVLQKFTNYRVKVAILGEFETYSSETFRDFIYESNAHGEYLFVSSLDDVIKRWRE